MQATTFKPLVELRQSQTLERQYPSLANETRTHVATGAAAFYLNRKEQTLRDWACHSGSGPVDPIRVNGRLAWPVASIKKLLGVA